MTEREKTLIRALIQHGSRINFLGRFKRADKGLCFCNGLACVGQDACVQSRAALGEDDKAHPPCGGERRR